MKQIRQGEVLLERVDWEDVPEGYSGTYVHQATLAIGETGNAHLLTAEHNVDVAWLHKAIESINELQKRGSRASNSELFVGVPAGGAKIHHTDRHGHQEGFVPEGIYRVRIKREQLPWEDEARRVWD